ncbi:MAG: tripartite tricarboxylate transporter substrate binding protein [Deltaproteobacteria bacterium]
MNNQSFFVRILRKALFMGLIFFIMGVLLSGSFRDVSWAQEFPSREIRLIIPYGAGGAIDNATRIFANRSEKILGVPVVVINNAAGGGAAGALSVSQAKPDGYTLLAGTSGVLILKPILTPDVRFRHTDFSPICRTIGIPTALWVTNEAPWKTLKDLVDYAKGNPGKLRVTVGQAGTLIDVLANLFKAEAGIDITNIPTTAGAAQTAALLGGHSELSIGSVSQGISFLKAGRLRALASTHKVPGFPMIKTFEEEGYPGVTMKEWVGIFSPKGISNPVLTKLTKAFEMACNDPSMREQLEKLYTLPEYLGPEETSKSLDRGHELALKILKQSGMVK